MRVVGVRTPQKFKLGVSDTTKKLKGNMKTYKPVKETQESDIPRQLLNALKMCEIA